MRMHPIADGSYVDLDAVQIVYLDVDTYGELLVKVIYVMQGGLEVEVASYSNCPEAEWKSKLLHWVTIARYHGNDCDCQPLPSNRM